MKIEFERPTPVVPLEHLTRNLAHSDALQLPGLVPGESRGKRLALVGGGPSARAALDELKDFDEIWAINGMAGWLAARGFDAVMLSVDPLPILAKATAGARRALLGAACDPTVFTALKESGAEIRVFDVRKHLMGATSATATPMLAKIAGFDEVTYYGCESSFGFDAQNLCSTLDAHELRLWLLLQAAGELHLTVAEFLMQAECLAHVIRAFPESHRERSGGLLRALVKDIDYDVRALSPALAEGLHPIETTERTIP